MAAPSSERDLERRMDQMRIQDGMKGPMVGSPQTRHGLSQPYKNGLPTFTPVIYKNPEEDDSDSDEDYPPPPPPAVSATVIVQSQNFPPPPPSSGYGGYNPPPPGTVCQATSRTMHGDHPPPPPQSRDYENLPPGPRVQRQPGPPPGGAPYPYQQPLRSPMQQQGVPHNQPRSPPSVRQEMQKIPDSPTHLYPSRSSLEASPYRYDPGCSQYPGSGYHDPERDGPQKGYNDPQRDGPPVGYNDPQRDGPQMGYNDPQRDGPQMGYNDPQWDGPQMGYKDPHRDGPPMSHQDHQRDGPPVSYQSGPPQGYDDGYGPSQHDHHYDHVYSQPQSPAFQKPQSPDPPHHSYSSGSPTSGQPIYATPQPRQHSANRSQSQQTPGGQRSPAYAVPSQSIAQSTGYGAPHAAPTSISLTPASATVTRTVPAAHSSVTFRTSESGPLKPSGPPSGAGGARGSGPEKSLKEAEVDALTNLLLQNMEATKDPEYYGLCNKCHQTIIGEDAGCTALDQVYHVQCFLCTQCEKSLKGCPFFAMEGNPYCEDCYLNTLEKCSVCSKPITDRILRATGKPYHPQCFTCVVCGKSLDGIPFTVDATNQIHCIEDFHRKFAPRCCMCRYPIMPEPGKEETVRVVAMDRSFHVGCYKCEDCGLVLSSEAEGRGCYPLDDHLLCKSCNAKRIQAMTGKMTTEL
ncbi:thyroid receptor-interacting protein 6-like isoform X2 [Lineus longissimus]